jgi:hypothetical protein
MGPNTRNYCEIAVGFTFWDSHADILKVNRLGSVCSIWDQCAASHWVVLVDSQEMGCGRAELHHVVRCLINLTLDCVDVTCHVCSLVEGGQRCPRLDITLDAMTLELPITLRGLSPGWEGSVPLITCEVKQPERIICDAPPGTRLTPEHSNLLPSHVSHMLRDTGVNNRASMVIPCAARRHWTFRAN